MTKRVLKPESSETDLFREIAIQWRDGSWWERLGYRLFKKGRYKILHGRHSRSVYLIRLYLLRTPWFAVFLHRFFRGDDDIHLHDHPFPFGYFVLSGRYYEVTPHEIRLRRPGSFRFRSHRSFHLVHIPRPSKPELVTPTWTLVIRGPKIKSWGFWNNNTWVWHRIYLGAAVPTGKALVKAYDLSVKTAARLVKYRKRRP